MSRTLGQLTDADRELRDTLCVYIGEQYSCHLSVRDRRLPVVTVASR